MAGDPATAPPLLGDPTRARVLSGLAARGEPASVEVLAADLALQPETVRLHLERLEKARFVRSHTVRGEGRGSGHRVWSSVAGALPIRSAYRTLSRWLVQGLSESEIGPLEIRETGRGIGHDLAAGRRPEDAIEALDALLSGLGFDPSHDGDGRFRLRSCPFHAATQERSPALVCSLHHGIVEGFTSAIDPDARISLFEPGDAVSGCRVGVSRS